MPSTVISGARPDNSRTVYVTPGGYQTHYYSNGRVDGTSGPHEAGSNSPGRMTMPRDARVKMADPLGSLPQSGTHVIQKVTVNVGRNTGLYGSVIGREFTVHLKTQEVGNAILCTFVNGIPLVVDPGVSFCVPKNKSRGTINAVAANESGRRVKVTIYQSATGRSLSVATQTFDSGSARSASSPTQKWSSAS